MNRGERLKEFGTTTASSPPEIKLADSAPPHIEISSHFNYGPPMFDKLKLERIALAANRNWLSRFMCRLFDCYRDAKD